MDIKYVRSRFFKHFDGTKGAVYASPGHINLIGEHTDYNGGFVFPGAIDKGMIADCLLYTSHCSFRHNRHFLGCSWQQDCFARLYGNFILLIINNTCLLYTSGRRANDEFCTYHVLPYPTHRSACPIPQKAHDFFLESYFL